MIEIEALRQAALAGNELAREAEECRLFADTKVIDMREQDKAAEPPRTCYSAHVHDPHDHDEVVWSEPRWVNPRTIWQRWCAGVRDESPYPKIVQAGERGVWVWEQDEVAAPGEFAICRRLIVSEGVGGGTAHFEVDIWRSPPREWPPVHVGSNGAGLRVDVETARAVRDWLTGWLAEQEGGADDGD